MKSLIHAPAFYLEKVSRLQYRWENWVKPSRLLELRIQTWESEKVKGACVCRAEYREKRAEPRGSSGCQYRVTQKYSIY